MVRGGSPTVVASGEDPHTHTALTAEDPFRIASITKTFVGTLALRLVQQQRLSLDDTVSHYLPDWPQGSQITVRMLLNHTSGLAPFGDDTGQFTVFLWLVSSGLLGFVMPRRPWLWAVSIGPWLPLMMRRSGQQFS